MALDNLTDQDRAKLAVLMANIQPITPKNADFTWTRVGVGVAVLTPTGYVLLRRAPGKHGAGEWSLPGGALERGESLENCARREILEEIGVSLESVSLLPYISEDLFPDNGQHWITHYLLARTTDVPRNMEPHKCDAMGTFWPQDFPAPQFVGLAALLDQGLLPRGW
jgi:8-oxo-dGTP diphosphatase